MFFLYTKLSIDNINELGITIISVVCSYVQNLLIKKIQRFAKLLFSFKKY